MESVRRFDQAHAPGYKLKDVNMVERGIAPEAARRRIELMKENMRRFRDGEPLLNVVDKQKGY